MCIRDSGEASVRYGQINVNIHVPDKVIAKGKGQAVYRTHFKRLIELRAKVVEVLKNHYEMCIRDSHGVNHS